ncbi:MAG: histone [Candidatus Woesearchaeota archaeon]
MISRKLLPLAAMEKLLKAAGAERVSEKAKAALRAVVEEMADEMAVSAVKFAWHAGRKTVKAGDIKLAARGL